LKNIISTDQLTKRYRNITAVNHLDLEIPEHSVFGILGPNGSGKTTTLGMILDVINPTSGTYSWFGNRNKKENRKRIGSILESPAFYPYLSAVSNLKIVARIKNRPYNNIDEVLSLVGLSGRKNDKYKTYSLGMKQRLAIASALLCDPSVLVLDEPTNGLDPQGIAEIRDIIKKLADEKKTVILASHLLDEVQKVCTHFGVLNHGELIYKGNVEEVSRDEHLVEVSTDDNNALLKILNDFPEQLGVKEENGKFNVMLKPSVSVSDFSRYLYEQGIFPTHLLTKRKNLEQQFLEILNQPENV